MDERKEPNLKPNSNKSNVKTRQGSGYLKQLFSSAKTTASSTHSHLKNLTTILVNFIPLDKIDASELQVRTHFDDEELSALAQSIKMHGVLQPVLVVQNGDRYKVIAGERRMRASKLAGMDRIPARVIMTDDKSTHEMALRENLDRADLHPIEEGEGYLSLLETKAYTTYEGIAKAFGKPKSRITECIGFTKLPAQTKEEILKRNYKQRSLLRTLSQTPPEKHLETIEQFQEDKEAIVIHSQEPEKAGEKTKVKAVAKPFQYLCNKKGIRVPSFNWKPKEGNEKLQDYIQQLETLIKEAKTQLEESAS